MAESDVNVPKGQQMAEEFHRTIDKTSAMERMAYFVSALVVCALPAYLYIMIHHMSLENYAIIYAVVILASAVVMMNAYQNVTTYMKRSKAFVIDRSIDSKGNGNPPVTAVEMRALAYSLWYNNLFFFAIFLVCGFYAFRNLDSSINYILSVSTASAVVTLSSAFEFGWKSL